MSSTRSPVPQEALGVIVDGLYAKLLGRAADPAGRAGFIQFLQNGGTVEQAIKAIITSPEFSGSSVSDVAFVQSLYYKLLGRFAGNAKVASWLSTLPTLGRSGVANAFVQSSEFRGDVMQQFYGPTPAPVRRWRACSRTCCTEPRRPPRER